jgi:hypothetical protein
MVHAIEVFVMRASGVFSGTTSLWFVALRAAFNN